MKKMFRLLMMAVMLIGATTFVSAQSTKSNETLSREYGQQIKVLSSEAKTLKIKLKEDKNNTQLKSELDLKNQEIKELKSKKKIVDTAIKSKKDSEKAQKKAEKAQKKATDAAADAQRMKETE